MADKQVDAQARDDLQCWLNLLRSPALSKEGMVKIYSDWTKNYETVISNGGWGSPALTVRYFSESFPKENRDRIKILDIGAGTGFVARGLRSEGFRHIDALDASADMLSLAKKDQLYENYFCEFLTATPLTCLKQDTYDGLTASGCFAPNHILPEALHEIIRVVKPGGIVVIVARNAYLSTFPLVPLIDTMEKNGQLKKVLTETTGTYYLNDEAIIWKLEVL